MGKKHQPYFFNPMWGIMGQAKPHRPGTYFYAKSEDVQYFWHTFDQILYRPSLAARFQPEDVHVVTSVNGASLLDEKGRPDKRRFSDHLPLYFRIPVELVGDRDAAESERNSESDPERH